MLLWVWYAEVVWKANIPKAVIVLLPKHPKQKVKVDPKANEKNEDGRI